MSADPTPAASGLTEAPREAVLGEVLRARDPHAEPESGWFVLGADGYFDVDNAFWCEHQDGDAPWTTDYFEMFGTLHDLRARTEAADREVARVTAAVEALIAAHVRVTPLASGSMIDAGIRASDREWARDLRAALSSADTTALDRERAKAAAEALREAADAWTQGAWSDVMLPSPTPPAVPVIAYANGMGDWLRDRAAAVSPEGGDA